MRDQLIRHVKHLFEKIPNSHDMQQEILQNSLDRYDDLISSGKTPEAAYQLTITGIGDLQEITASKKKRKPFFLFGIPIALIISIIILLTFVVSLWIVIGQKDHQNDQSLLTNATSTNTTPPSVSTQPSSTLPSAPLYTVSYANAHTFSLLLEPLEMNYPQGAIVKIITNALTDVDLALYVDGEFINYQHPVDDENGTHWEFYFVMPNHNVVIKLQTENSSPLHPDLLYANAQQLANEGKFAESAIAFSRIEDHLDARERCFHLWAQVRTHTTVVSIGSILVGVQKDGSIITANDNQNHYPELNKWTDIQAIAASASHIAALKEDGTVVATGSNSHGQCNVENWTDIVAVDCGLEFTVGLKADGSLVISGNLQNSLILATFWTDVVMIEAAGRQIIALHYDGTVTAIGDPDADHSNAPQWNDIIDIYLDSKRAIYLRADGSFFILGESGYTTNKHIPGLLTIESDGNYVAGKMLDGSWYIEEYGISIAPLDDIVAIIDYSHRKLGLRKDGTLVLLCFYAESSLETPFWTQIK